MPTTDERFDRLSEQLFGEQEIRPGILVRMDQRLEKLEGNPMVRFGYFTRSAGRALVAIVSVLASVGGIIWGANMLRSILHK